MPGPVEFPTSVPRRCHPAGAASRPGWVFFGMQEMSPPHFPRTGLGFYFALLAMREEMAALRPVGRTFLSALKMGGVSGRQESLPTGHIRLLHRIHWLPLALLFLVEGGVEGEFAGSKSTSLTNSQPPWRRARGPCRSLPIRRTVGRCRRRRLMRG